jgi:formate transporter
MQSQPLMPHSQPLLDALLPADIATRAAEVGARKCRLSFWPLLTLAVLAGAFISLGAIFATPVTPVTPGAIGILPFGLTRLLAGMVFCLGLILVVVGGAELFTGNALISMAWASGTVFTAQMLRNWGIVYSGNLLGALATVALVYGSAQYTFGGGAVGLTAASQLYATYELSLPPYSCS